MCVYQYSELHGLSSQCACISTVSCMDQAVSVHISVLARTRMRCLHIHVQQIGANSKIKKSNYAFLRPITSMENGLRITLFV